VVVTIDTLRADRLGCYGSTQVETPHLDRLAREGARALHGMVHIPMTLPSHISLLTGKLPFEHGIRDNLAPVLPEDVPTLAETLRAEGFRTAGFVSSVVLARHTGLARGFETYSDEFEEAGDDVRFLNTVQKRGDEPLAEAVSWLEAAGSKRSFLWLHLYDPHDPYEPPEPYFTRYRGRPYDGEVAWADELVGRLDEALERMGRAAETLLVVTSDHGEGLGEHGETLHGYFTYQSTLSVPLLFRGPGIPAGSEVTVTVGSIDLFPTLLDLLGVPRPDELRVSGRSLAGTLRGDADPEEAPAYAESLIPLLHFGWSDLRVMRDGHWKYIQAPRPELYDLAEDPGETRNLVGRMGARAKALREALGERLTTERETTAVASRETVPRELLEQLGALGYVGAGHTVSTADAGADPKDKIEEFRIANNLIREGLVRLQEKDAAGSAERFQELLRRGISSFEIHYYLGRALLMLQRSDEAADHLEKAIDFLPGYAATYDALAECHVAQGQPREALKVLDRGQSAVPDDAALHEREGQLWGQLGDPGQAIRAYERARVLAPQAALLRIRLGELYRDARQLDEAIAVMREALALDPAPASYWNSLGMVLGGAERLAEAENAFREALTREPGNPQYVYNLGLALLRQGLAREAESEFRRVLELDPRFGAARERLAEITSALTPS
jgi:arylsulfatase A-like enzyme/Flp pilus assembly protein TadD